MWVVCLPSSYFTFAVESAKFIDAFYINAISGSAMSCQYLPPEFGRTDSWEPFNLDTSFLADTTTILWLNERLVRCLNL
jgi:hypothetical protein